MRRLRQILLAFGLIAAFVGMTLGTCNGLLVLVNHWPLRWYNYLSLAALAIEAVGLVASLSIAAYGFAGQILERWADSARTEQDASGGEKFGGGT